MTNKRHYIYIDSRNRPSGQKVSDFTVHLHNPIKNVVRTAVVNFSIPNTMYNVNYLNNTFSWFEIAYYANNFFYRTFDITLDIGYYNITQLMDTIVQKMNETTGRAIAAETTTTYSYSITDDFQVVIKGLAANSTESNRHWGFLIDDNELDFNNSIIHHILSFTRKQVLTLAQLQDVANIEGIATPLNKTPSGMYTKAWAQSRNNLIEAERSLTSDFSYSENQALLHLASDLLSENSQRMVFRNGQSDTMKTHVLETIPILTNRWSWVQLNKTSNDLLYHSMDNVNVSHFDLKLLNEHYNIYDDNGIADFKCCIMFETSDDTHHEGMVEMYRNYNISGYRQAH